MSAGGAAGQACARGPGASRLAGLRYHRLTVAEIRTVLVPLDGSEPAESALELAETLASALGSRLALVRVTPTLEEVVARTSAGHMAGAAIFVDVTPHWEEERAEADRYLERLAGGVRQRGLQVETHHVQGDPAQEILRLAREVPADLVVMSTRGQGGLKRLVLGSTADAVVRAAAAPVLLVPLARD